MTMLNEQSKMKQTDNMIQLFLLNLRGNLGAAAPGHQGTPEGTIEKKEVAALSA